MFPKIIIFAVFLVFAKGQDRPYNFPEDFESCDVESENGSTCLRGLIQNWAQMLGTRGIDRPIRLSIEPMVVDFWVLNIGLNFLNSTEYLWDSTFMGFSNSTVISASYNPENYTLVYTAHYPRIHEVGRYQMFGVISFEDGTTDSIYGHDTYDKYMIGLTLTHTITFVPVPRDQGVQYLQVYRYGLEMDGLQDTSLHWNNLYGGDDRRANRSVGRIASNGLAMAGALAGTFREMIIDMFRLYTEDLVTSVPRSELRRHFFSHA